MLQSKGAVIYYIICHIQSCIPLRSSRIDLSIDIDSGKKRFGSPSGKPSVCGWPNLFGEKRQHFIQFAYPKVIYLLPGALLWQGGVSEISYYAFSSVVAHQPPGRSCAD